MEHLKILTRVVEKIVLFDESVFWRTVESTMGGHSLALSILCYLLQYTHTNYTRACLKELQVKTLNPWMEITDFTGFTELKLVERNPNSDIMQEDLVPTGFKFIPPSIRRLEALKILDFSKIRSVILPKELTTMPLLPDAPQEPIKILVDPNATIPRKLDQPKGSYTEYRQLVIERDPMSPSPSRCEVISRTAQDALLTMKVVAPTFVAVLAVVYGITLLKSD